MMRQFMHDDHPQELDRYVLINELCIIGQLAEFIRFGLLSHALNQ